MGFYKGKRVLVTGHSGFKGSWLCKVLCMQGAEVIGYSLPPTTSPNLFELGHISSSVIDYFEDIRDFGKLLSVFERHQPTIVIHMAAQPIVRDSYSDPRYTYDANVMGTVNVLECVRQTKSVRSFLNVTTDKVYYNQDLPDHPFSESEPLDGFDPYSNSKSCSELVTAAYRRSFFGKCQCAISTARAGNVIGGGDFSHDRIMADLARAVIANKELVIRNPNSTRPYQHVLEPIFAYLTIARSQLLRPEIQGSFNVGPALSDCVTTLDLIKFFEMHWNRPFSYTIQSNGGPHEANYLQLNTNKITSVLGWRPRWGIEEAVAHFSNWLNTYLDNPLKIGQEMEDEIIEYGACVDYEWMAV